MGRKILRYSTQSISQSPWRFFVLSYTVVVHFACDMQLRAITDRMVMSLDFDINGFFSEIDRSLEASRRVFRRLDSVMMALTEADWLRIEAKVRS